MYNCYIFFLWTVSGISGKSQILFALVYTTRYLDLVTSYVSMYNTLMKIFFIAASYATIYLIYIKFKATYDHNHDTFRIEFLLIPAVILALLINHDFTFMEVSTHLEDIYDNCYYPMQIYKYLNIVGVLDVQHLFRIRGNIAAVIYGQ